MAFFGPPPPRQTRGGVLQATRCPAPYLAQPAQQIPWEREQKRLCCALKRVSKTVDQSEPAAMADVSMHKARERLRVRACEESCRIIGIQNKRLMGNLHAISKQPSTVSKL